jgi:electron transfer flavoprotein beta subunit
VIAVRPDGSGIDSNGLKFVCDPFDEFAVAQAVAFREQRTDVKEIVALAVGDAATSEALRHALAMGADRAALVTGEALPMTDEVAVARLLRAAIARLGPFDAVLCGKQGTDNDSGELGPALAECLGWPHVGAVTKLELALDGLSLRANRRIEGAEEVLQVRLPALLTCEKGLIEPKHPPLPRVMKAKKEPIETIPADGLAAAPRRSAKASRILPLPGRPACQFIEGDAPNVARELVRRLRDEAKVL